MTSVKKSPVRMCIVCKSRLSQKTLNRFQLKEGNIRVFEKHGRSFYICEMCLNGNKKKLIKTINQKYNLNFSCEDDVNFKENAVNG